MAETEPAIAEVVRMLSSGMQNDEIIATLQERGYSNETIQSALALAATKASIEGPSQSQPQPARMIEPPAPGMQPSMLTPANVQSTIIPRAPQQFLGPAQPFVAQQMQSAREAEEKIEEIAEAIIEEKWQRMVEEVGDIKAWKERVSTDLIGIKQETLRIQGRLEAVQNTVLGRVKDYDKTIEDVGADVKAIEILLKNILEPLSTNVKELKAITDKLRR